MILDLLCLCATGTPSYCDLALCHIVLLISFNRSHIKLIDPSVSTSELWFKFFSIYQVKSLYQKVASQSESLKGLLAAKLNLSGKGGMATEDDIAAYEVKLDALERELERRMELGGRFEHVLARMRTIQEEDEMYRRQHQVTNLIVTLYFIPNAHTNNSQAIWSGPINRMRIVSVCGVNRVRFYRLSGHRFRSRRSWYYRIIGWS